VVATEVSGKAEWTGTAEYTLAAVRRFDFNGPLNDTAFGFVGVRGADTYTTSRGFGWDAVVTEFERVVTSLSKGTTALYRDGHFGTGSARTFRVQVAAGLPGPDYQVRVYLGDRDYARDQIQVLMVGHDTNNDGRLDVTFRDLGGATPYWVVNGMDVWALTATDPGAAWLRAADASQAIQSDAVGSERLTYAALSTVVNQAIGIWSATGLTSAQVAELRSISVEIVDLNSQGGLGVTTPERILIDDDGDGRGWSDASGPVAGEYDLLTVVLHEMGHVLGRQHDAGDDLMNALLRPGERHLPDVDTVFTQW
jgi:hypothetical protein